MIVRLGLEFDRVLPEWPTTQIGRVTTGPDSFLSILETQLGLPPTDASTAKRVVDYLGCLKQCDSSDRFYHRSLQVDAVGVARTLLYWRDEWYMAGWEETFSQEAGKRLQDMQEVERLAVDEVTLSVGQRLLRVLEALASCRTLIEKVELVDPLSVFPHLWQRILSFFELEYLEVDHRPLRADADSDLGKLQAALRKIHSAGGKKPAKMMLAGDGSVLVLTAQSREVSAGFLARHLKGSQTAAGTAVLVGRDGTLFDNGLEAVDAPRCGFRKASPWRPVLQVLPLAMGLVWDPLDPYLLLQFLTHPVGPLTAWVRRRLAQAVVEAPGIGGGAWQNALSRLTELEKERGEGWEERWTQLREDIDFWLDCRRFDPDGGAPMDRLAERCNQVAAWVNRSRWATEDPADRRLYAEAAGHAQDLSQAFAGLIAQGITSLPRRQMSRLLETVIGNGSTTACKPAECGHPQAAEDPAVFVDDWEELVWWDFSMPDLPQPYPWTRAELASLKASGVRLQPLNERLEHTAVTWLRPVMATQKRLMLVLHSSDEAHHPLWDQITSCASGWIERDVEGMIQRGESMPGGEPFSRLLPDRPLPRYRRWWRLDAGHQLDKRRTESFSSLDTFIKSPYQWVLRYKARLKTGSVAELPGGNLLKGSLVHRLIEDFFNAHPGWRSLNLDEIVPWIDSRLERLIQEEGAVLLCPGHAMEREAFKTISRRALTALIDHLKSANVARVAVERPASGTFCGGEIAGYIDLLLEDPTGREIVLDVKWGGEKYRGEDLRNNQHLQLAVYARMRREESSGRRWPPQAYFIIDSARVLAQDATVFQEAAVHPPDNGEPIERLWERFEATWRWRRAQIDRGLIEVTVEGAPPDEDSVPPEGGFLLEDNYDSFNDFAALTGWGEDE